MEATTFGKYFTGSKEESLALLGERLGMELEANTKALAAKSCARMSLRRSWFVIPLDKRFTLARLRKDLKEAKNREAADYAARRLALRERWKQWGQPWVTRLSLGPQVHVLSLPSEVVVEYQLFAQGLVPEHFLACAAYGESTFFYFPTAAMYEEGGYEPERGMWTPGVESALKTAIRNVLEPLR